MDYVLAASNIFLTYHADFIIRSTSLTRVQISTTDQVSIELRGEGLPAADAPEGLDFYCIFGPYWNRTISKYDPDFDQVVLRANLSTTDGTAVRCENVPTTFARVPNTTERYPVTLSLSYDLQELQWNQTLDYYAPPVVSDIVPRRATQAQTEFALELRGTGFLDAAEELTCKLRSTNGSRTEYPTSLVAYESSTLAHCVFNLVPRGDYVLSVSMNAEQYTDALVLFQVLPAI